MESDFRSIGAGFNPEVGFVRRTDFNQLRSTVFYNIYPKKGNIQVHGPGFDFDVLRSGEFGLTDWDVNLLYSIGFKNTAEFNLRLRRQYTFFV